MYFKLFLFIFSTFILTGCAQKKLDIIKFQIKNIKVKETPNSWFHSYNPIESPFYAVSLDNTSSLAGTLIFRETFKDFATGQINLVNRFKNKKNETLLGNWPIHECNTNLTNLKGLINENVDLLENRNIIVEGPCYYINLDQ